MYADGTKDLYNPLEKQLSPALHLARKEHKKNRINLALALCAILASTVPSPVKSAFNFIIPLEIHSRNEVAASLH